MKSKYYKEIMACYGADELKQHLKRWDTLSQNLGRIKPEMPIILPDYLLLAGPGTGKSMYFQLLADYLEDVGLMTFQGDRKCVEFQLMKAENSHDYSEISRLKQAISLAAGFHDSFQGLVAVDCTNWIGELDKPCGAALLSYLARNSEKWLIFLVLDCQDEDKVQHIEALLSGYLRINVVRLDLPKTSEMLEELTNQIARYGFLCSEDAKQLLRNTLNKLRREKYFAGYHTLDMLSEEIIYRIYSERAGIPTELTAELLEPFGPDGIYTKQMIDICKKHYIGF